MALSSPEQGGRDAARSAMMGINHVRFSFSDWFGNREYFLSRLDHVLFIGFQESLAADFQALKLKFGMDPDLQLPVDEVRAHRTPANMNLELEPQAIDNLTEWYRDDVLFLNRARKKLPPSTRNPRSLRHWHAQPMTLPLQPHWAPK